MSRGQKAGPNRGPVSGPSQPIEGANNEKADAISGVATAVNDFLIGVLKDVRTESDALALEEEVAALFKRTNAKGVLIARYTGNSPNTSGVMHQTYLGLQVIGGGSSQEEAISDFWRRKAEHDKKNQPTTATMCTIENPSGATQYPRASVSAAPEGYNRAYARQRDDKIVKYLEKNPDNEKTRESGNPFQKGFVEPEFLYIEYNDWGNLVAMAHRKRNAERR